MKQHTRQDWLKGTYRKEMRPAANRIRRVALAHTFMHILFILTQISPMFASSASLDLRDMLMEEGRAEGPDGRSHRVGTQAAGETRLSLKQIRERAVPTGQLDD